MTTTDMYLTIIIAFFCLVMALEESNVIKSMIYTVMAFFINLMAYYISFQDNGANGMNNISWLSILLGFFIVMYFFYQIYTIFGSKKEEDPYKIDSYNTDT